MKKIFSALLLLAATVLTTAVQAQTINGDLNHNGDLDVDDITLLINSYLTGEKEYFTNDESNEDDSHEAVDLGLSVMWATMNVGANAPEEYGDYFAWGETESKTDYNRETYKWYNSSENTLTKYCASGGYGTVDNKKVLDLEDDAAHVNWGGTWRMPTIDEIEELLFDCSWEWTIQNGVNGQKVTGPNGNSIFLPAAGNRWYNNLEDAGSYGGYWLNSLSVDYDVNASNLDFFLEGMGWGDVNRYIGRSVRAVCPLQVQTINGDLNHNGDLDVDDITLLINDYLTGEAERIEPPHEAVDLGLSVKWATMNVGATSPEDYGYYLAWGETQPKDTYDWDTYQWGTENQLIKYNNDSSTGIVDGKTTLDSEDDAASVHWGDTWRMPTPLEVNELKNKCTWTWTTQNGIGGFVVTGPNGRSIFLPATHFYYSETLGLIDSYDGEYWTNSLGGFESSMAWYMTFSYIWRISDWAIYIDYRTGSRCRGRCVRPVCP